MRYKLIQGTDWNPEWLVTEFCEKKNLFETQESRNTWIGKTYRNIIPQHLESYGLKILRLCLPTHDFFPCSYVIKFMRSKQALRKLQDWTFGWSTEKTKEFNERVTQRNLSNFHEVQPLGRIPPKILWNKSFHWFFCRICRNPMLCSKGLHRKFTFRIPIL